MLPRCDETADVALDPARCWGCVCFPASAACERNLAEGPDVLVHTGICFPLFSLYKEWWDRAPGTNTFYKRLKPGETLQYESPSSALCFGPGCTLRFCQCPGDRDPPRHVPAKEIEGCWGCVCWPGFAAIEKKRAEGDDTLWHTGICCPLMLPYSEPYDRQPGTNIFKKRKDPNDSIHYTGGKVGTFLCLGVACSCRLC